ncbi:MAG: GTP cyclohydrolase I [Bacilli bacterium]|nr:GTP cyclohydrolase I [Bacilli bacterium]
MFLTGVENCLEEALGQYMGLDLSDPNLVDTPKRIAKMWCNEFCKNVGVEFMDYSCFPNDKEYDQIIVSDTIEFVSMCSHHFLPFYGKGWVAYLPDKKLVGLSKMSRAVKHYAARPQLQENLCHEVIDNFVHHVQPRACMVILKASHGCIACRGTNQPNQKMVTSAVYGEAKEMSFKNEVFNLINLP